MSWTGVAAALTGVLVLTACGEDKSPDAGPTPTASDIAGAGVGATPTAEFTWVTDQPELPGTSATPDGVKTTFVVRYASDVRSARLRVEAPGIGGAEFGAEFTSTSYYPAGPFRYTATATVVGANGEKHKLTTKGTLHLLEGASTTATFTLSTKTLKVRVT